MDNLQEVRHKRQRIRLNLRETLISRGQILQNYMHSATFAIKGQTKEQTNEIEEEDGLIGRMRRKTSLDIRQNGQMFDMFECNEIYIFKEFTQMFDLLDKIDDGAESVVYQGIKKETQTKFAIKVFRKKDQDVINRIKTQFRILKNLDHPNIIKAYNLFVHEKIGISHLVLQYCDFPNLRFHMNKNRTLKETQIAEILSGILSALAYFHSQGGCHRDIKPQNVMFNPVTRQLKLIDFEISKMIKYSHQKLQMMTNTGTVFYMAPEMLKSKIYSQLIDIWAVGIICYQMATGHYPFKNLYEGQVMRQIKDEQPKYDKSNITDLCINFMKKCLQKDPLKRFSASQALKSPFILKYSSVSSSNSSPMKRKNSEDYLRNPFEIEVSKCLNEDSGLKHKDSLDIDNGIRVVINQKPIKIQQ